MTATSPGIEELLEALRSLVAEDCDMEAARLLSERLGDPDQAEALIPIAPEMARHSPQPKARLVAGEALARLRPGHASTWRQIADIARGNGDYQTATRALEQAAKAPDGNAHDRLQAALTAYQDNDLVRAENLYCSLGDDEAAACGLAVIAIARGETQIAADILRGVLASSPSSPNALRLLAMVDADPVTIGQLVRIAEDEAQPANIRSAVAFALTQQHDRRNETAEAMRWAKLANGLVARYGRPYDRSAAERLASEQIELFDRLPETREALLDQPRPLVVVGLPRSGTSLLESLLAAHPDVTAGGERTDLILACQEVEIVLRSKGMDAACRLFSRRREGLIVELADRLFTAGIQSEAYLDKLPLNTPYAGLIARLLPEAKILFVRRNPVETALSIWLHDFSQAYPYSSDLATLAHALELNDRLLEAWRSRLGDQFLEVDHDALCADPKNEGRRIFEFCGLTWNEAYLEPETRRAATNTFSAIQVRQPIRPRLPRAPLYAEVLGALTGTAGES